MAPPSPGEQARTALAAVLAALPDAPAGSVLARSFETPAVPRAALVALIARAAFVVCAEARGLLAVAPELALATLTSTSPGAWPFALELLAPAAAAALAALRAERQRAEFAALEPDELGSFYEGLLATGVALAERQSVIVRQPRPAGGAAEDRLVELDGAPREHGGRKSARAIPVAAGRFALVGTVDRRRSGAHYTPRALTERVVETTLGPLLGAEPTPEAVLAVRVCDPALGTGAFLVAACRYLAQRLLEAEARVSGRVGETERAVRQRAARRRVAERCLHGVDRDALAVEVARQALFLAIGDASLPNSVLERSLRVGDALLGPPPLAAESAPARDGAAPGVTTRSASAAARSRARAAESVAALDWEAAFPEVLGAGGGFTAFLGNPPWVSYAGRAAQPLAKELRAAYDGYEAFRGYRNLQGLFVERCARLLRPRGRLGLVLPSSMSELGGYLPTRRAHDRYCEPDAELSDLGADAFDGVFQPCMVLCSTRRAAPLAEVPERAWPVERPDLDALARGLIEKLTRPPLPANLFGERGLQSTGEDTRHLAREPDGQHSIPLRSGGDVEAFRLRAPSEHADPTWFGRRLRAGDEWARVRLLVRQTARVPVVALSDGAAFRNSLLAGFEDSEHPAPFLVAYLNSTPIRWLHFMRHRDARQGMPQLKVAHLRATPSPPTRALVGELEAVTRELSRRGRSILAGEQAELDELVEDAFALGREERRRLAEFRASVADARPRA